MVYMWQYEFSISSKRGDWNNTKQQMQNSVNIVNLPNSMTLVFICMQKKL